MSFVNPLTALSLVGKVESYGHGSSAGIVTAAASQLGRMIAKIAVDKRLPMIYVVRNKDQEDILKGKDIGVSQESILNSTDEDFFPKLKVLANKLGAKVVLECIGGEMTG